MAIYFKYQDDLYLRFWNDQICGREIHWIMGGLKCIYNLCWNLDVGV
jgi:hypothetical protein